MSRKHQLRTDRETKSPIINVTSKQQETALYIALSKVVNQLNTKFGDKISLKHQSQWYLKDIVTELKSSFPKVEFHDRFKNSSIRPDGGILYLEGKPDDKFIYPILIAEVKNQGTNDQRLKEGKPEQAKGNAIERLGKNLIGLRTALLRECIFPFVCFGYGCDFAQGSSILDRVRTMAMFGVLNQTRLYDEENGKFKRGSFYFREEEWQVDEMAKIMYKIAECSVYYYFSKYSESHFIK
ncbi:EcoRI family type II restriction endonuclease [Fontisphaera persica]|uniref:EcoRI family type II restriction endonuclease n=1 Tax=Fontisphaera persica TaxID=2974023 RepID=UPI0024BFF7D5|nr:EcoRI family type II restriction endonuclease [Fontisphaera persica]WCJ58806.1 EcoRI family type II restriction endonuclease [Fontisphaera persica]